MATAIGTAGRVSTGSATAISGTASTGAIAGCRGDAADSTAAAVATPAVDYSNTSECSDASNRPGCRRAAAYSQGRTIAQSPGR